MTDEKDNEEYIRELEGEFLDLTLKVNTNDGKGDETIALNMKRQYVYEELVRQRRQQYEQQFESIQDDYDY